MITTPLRKTTKETSRFAKGLSEAAVGVSHFQPQVTSFVSLDELEHVSHQYLRHCLMRHLSPQTIQMKEYCLRLLLDFHEDYDQCTRSSLEDLSLKLGRGDTVTQNTYLQHIKTFLHWAADDYGIAPLYKDIIVPQRPKRTQSSPNHEHLKLLEKATDKARYPMHYKAMFYLLTDAGLRVSEMCNLNMEDVSLKTFPGSAWVRHGKGDKARAVYFGQKTTKVLFRYTKFRRSKPNAPVVVSHGGTKRGQRMTRYGVLTAIKTLAGFAGITGVSVTPHALRRAAGIELLRNGADMRELQLLYGHEDISTTIIYVNQADSMLEEKFKKASPVDNL